VLLTDCEPAGVPVPRDRSCGIPPLNSPASCGGPSDLVPRELTVLNPPAAAAPAICLDPVTRTNITCYSSAGHLLSVLQFVQPAGGQLDNYMYLSL